MPDAFFVGLRNDVVAVARQGEASSGNRLLEQEPEVMRLAVTYLSRDMNPR